MKLHALGIEAHQKKKTASQRSPKHIKVGWYEYVLPLNILFFVGKIYIFLGHLVFYNLISMLVYISTLRNLHDVHLAEWAKVQTQIIRATDAAPDLLSLNLSEFASKLQVIAVIPCMVWSFYFLVADDDDILNPQRISIQFNSISAC